MFTDTKPGHRLESLFCASLEAICSVVYHIVLEVPFKISNLLIQADQRSKHCNGLFFRGRFMLKRTLYRHLSLYSPASLTHGRYGI